MKKLEKAPPIKDGHRKQRFVFKKINKQLISIVGTTLLLVGNYAIGPIQVLANETATSTPPVSAEQALPTIASSDPVAPVSGTEQTQEETTATPAAEAAANEEQAPQNQAAPESNTTDITESTEETTTETIDESREADSESPKQKVTTAEASDWQAQESEGYMVIQSYSGDMTNITVPSTINDKPVQINLYAVFGSALNSTTRTFSIEKAANGKAPVKLTGSFKELFYDNSVLQSVIFNDADTSAITNMSSMFRDCSNLINLDVSGWNTENVTNMSGMFWDCSKLTSLDVSKWKMGNISSLDRMFYNCRSLTELKISGWNTGSVSIMSNMFYSCTSLTELNISRWNTSSVTNMTSMFYNCVGLTELNLSNWNTENVTAMSGMFSNCLNLTTLDLSSWVTRAETNTDGMFSYSTKLNTLTCSKAFVMSDNQGLPDLPKSTNNGKTTYYWSEIGDMDKAYASTTNLITAHNGRDDADPHTYKIDKKHTITFNTDGGSDTPAAVAVWDGEKLAEPDYQGTNGSTTFVGWADTNGTIYDFDQAVTSPFELKAKWEDLEWITEDAGEYTRIIGYNGDPETITVPSVLDGKPVVVDLSNVTNLSGYLKSQTKTFAIEKAKEDSESVKLTGSLEGLFADNNALESADFADVDISAIENMEAMFQGCSNLTELDLTGWNTENVTDMFNMFNNCPNLSILTCSEAFGMTENQHLRDLPEKENNEKTTYYWVVDGDKKKTYKSTDALIEGHNELSDTDAHTYTIEKNHAVTFDTDGGSDAPSDTVVWDGEKLAEPDYQGTKNNNIFKGWTFEDQPYDFDKSVGVPLKLKASWEESVWITQEAGEYTRIIGYKGEAENITVPTMLYDKPVEIDLANVENLSGYLRTETETFKIEKAKESSKPVKLTGSFSDLFRENSALTSADFADADTSTIEDMSYMFNGCSSLITLHASGWNTENVITMLGIFVSCSKLSNLDLSGWTTANVSNMGYMFYGCSNLATLTCSKAFKLDVSQWLRDLPNEENDEKTIYYWVVDGDKEKTYKSTSNLMAGHNGLQDNDPHTYTIEKKHTVTFNTDGGSDTPDAVTVWDNDYLTDPDYQGSKDYAVFKEWVDKDGDPYDFNQPVNEPLDLKISWEDSIWNTVKSGEYTKIIGYRGDKESITIPSMLNGRSVEVDLRNVENLREYLRTETKTFKIEEAKEDSKPVKLMGTFYELFNTNISLISADFSDADTSAVTNMSYMFDGCSNLTDLDVSGWNTENVKSMWSMFNGCNNLTSLDVSDWNTENVADTSNMFNGCSNLTTLNVSGWDTGKVTDMLGMFHGCSNLTALDVSGWNTGNVTEMQIMFYDCSSLTTLDVSDWNTENVTSMGDMFNGCINLATIDVSEWNTENVVEVAGMFSNCSKLTMLDLSDWTMKKVKQMQGMFYECSSLTNLNASGWTTENVDNMFSMFSGCSALTTLDVSSWNTENVADTSNMFNGCSNLTKLTCSRTFKMNSDQALRALPEKENEDSTTYYWVVDDNKDKTYGSTDTLIAGHNALSDTESHTYTIEKKHTVTFNTDGGSDTPDAVTVWDNDYLTDPDYQGSKDYAVFKEWVDKDGKPYDFNQPVNEPIELKATWEESEWNTVKSGEYTEIIGYRGDKESITIPSMLNGRPVEVDLRNVENLSEYLRTETKTFKIEKAKEESKSVKLVGAFKSLFAGNKLLESADFADADTSDITEMRFMFTDCTALTTLDVSGWNTGKVTDMGYMFTDCTALTTLDVSGWNTGNVRTMEYMFTVCSALTTLDVSGWNTKNVENMNSMFNSCSTLTTLNVSDWNTENVTDMNGMFNNCSALTILDISDWNTEKVTAMQGMFYSCSALTTLDVSGWNTENVRKMQYMFNSCNNLTNLDVSGWDTENVTDMNGMFNDCSSLTVLDVSAWNTKNVANMKNMFNGCSSLITLNVSDWNTEKVADVGYMFNDCSSLTALDISGWNTGDVTDMHAIAMFQGCSNLTTLDVSEWNTENVADMRAIFSGCTNLTTLTCSKNFKMNINQLLRRLPVQENDRKTVYYWVVDDNKDKTYGSTDALIAGHNALSDTDPHTYTIEKNHVVTFDTNEGSDTPDTVKIWDNDYLTDPDYQGTKAHHQFVGWFVGDQAFEFNETKITSPVTLTAKWRLNEYAVQFHKNNGTGMMEKQTFQYGEQKALSENTFSRTGYTFTDWNTQANGEGNSFTDKQEVKNLSEEDGVTIDLYAQWKLNTYTVTFDSQGGSTVPAQSYTIEKGIDKLPTPAKKGYTFQGWYDGEKKVESIATGEIGNRNLTAKWKLDTYTITFDSKGGKEVDDKEYTVETDTFELPELDRTGYTFQGWFNAEDNRFTKIEKGTVGNKDLTAKWEAVKYTVTFDSQGGLAVPAQSYTIEEGIDKLPTPIKKGYAFQGWYDGKEKVDSIATGEIGNRNLTAKWKLDTYTITFDSKGGKEVDDKEYTVETDTFELPELDRTGYTFEGWFDAEGNRFTEIEKGTIGDKNLTAKWEAVKYTVTFDSQGGSEVPAQSYTIEKGIDKLPTPTKKGYTFQGWYDGEKKVESIATGEIGNRNLTAKWKLDTYTITFDSKGGKEVDDKEYTVETDTFELPELDRTGYTFEGWFDAEGNRFTEIEKGTIGDKNLTAKWEAVKYTVTFDSQGGSDVPAQSYTIEKGIPELPTPIKKGYTFQGWYDGEKKVESIATGEIGNRNLTAKWKLDTYTITFDSKGGKEVDDKEYTVETDTFELPELDRTGYTFEGWFDAEGNRFTEIEKGTIGDKNLTAKWEAVKYTVTFDSQGGLAVPAQSYTIEKGIDKLPTPAKKGYTFQGWYDGEKKVESIATGEIGNRNLTAKWEIITYTITFDDVTIPPINYTIESETISLPKKTRLGYTFLGWLVSEETVFRALAAPQTIVQEIKTGTTGNLQLSAQWQANQYTITFEPNGGKGEQTTQTLTYDTAVKLSGNKFTREGYTFTGWNTQADGKGTAFANRQEIKNLFTEPNSTLTLFAQWTPNKTALEELVTKEGEKPRNKNNYTEESWKIYEDALAKAKQILENPNATSEEIQSALAALQAAINNLKPIKSGATGIPTSTNNPTTSANRSATSTGKVYPSALSTKSYPRTGMLAESGLMIAGIAAVGAAVGAAVVSWQKRKGK